MQITQLQNRQESKQQWNSFVQSHPYGSVHQLWEWAQFQSKSGTREEFWVLAAHKNTPIASASIEAGALILKQNLPFGLCWLYCPGGPLVDWNNKETTKALFEAIQKLAKQQKTVFFRFELSLPTEQKNLTDSPKNKSLNQTFTLLKAKKAHSHYQPESTLLIDLSLSEEQILAQMKPKGRYNIKVAKKHTVHVRESKPDNHAGFQKDLQSFYDLLKTTAHRDTFHIHPLKFYEQFMEQLGPHRAKLYLAEYSPSSASNNEEKTQTPPILLSAAIVTYFKDTATYYFGASSNEYRNTMAPYLLHWEIMRAAKATGYTQYDLFGIAPAEAKNHPWQKVTEFKMKFGGQRLDFVPAQEIIYRPLWLLIIRVVKHVAPQVTHWFNRLLPPKKR